MSKRLEKMIMYRGEKIIYTGYSWERYLWKWRDKRGTELLDCFEIVDTCDAVVQYISSYAKEAQGAEFMLKVFKNDIRYYDVLDFLRAINHPFFVTDDSIVVRLEGDSRDQIRIMLEAKIIHTKYNIERDLAMIPELEPEYTTVVIVTKPLDALVVWWKEFKRWFNQTRLDIQQSQKDEME